ncbi:MAG TPA: hypothetical protein VFI73_08980 [Candidatus Nitrosopolaris sp.]|nr:hypothetical protein [Candidatus Nitrosopolaris sp.]
MISANKALATLLKTSRDRYNSQYEIFAWGVYDMIFIDVVVLFVRTASITWSLFNFTPPIPNVFTVILLIYLVSEFTALIIVE